MGTITMKTVTVGALARVCPVAGYLFVIQAVRVGDLSVSAPFRYTMVGAVAVGIVLFDETPDALTLVGCTLIVAAGVITARTDARPRAARST
jgi:drug/metabolite transporter (DMT)-like permease